AGFVLPVEESRPFEQRVGLFLDRLDASQLRVELPHERPLALHRRLQVGGAVVDAIGSYEHVPTLSPPSDDAPRWSFLCRKAGLSAFVVGPDSLLDLVATSSPEPIVERSYPNSLCPPVAV